MSNVYAFLANGFEEVECLSVVDLLRRANINVTMVSIENDLFVTGSHQIIIQADSLFSDVNTDDADLLFLPGGMPGTTRLSSHEGLRKALLHQADHQKRIAAICAAPSVLGELHLLEGKSATCYPGFENKLLGANYQPDGIVTDGLITTARGLGYAIDLGLTLIALLKDQALSDSIRTSIQHSQAHL